MVLQVRNVMTRSLIAADRLATLTEASSLMTSWRVGSIVVTVDGRPVGLVDEADVCRAVLNDGAPLDCPLYAAATRTPLRLPEDMTVQRALEALRRAGMRHALVEDHGAVTGLVALSDLVAPALDGDGVDLFNMAVESAQRPATSASPRHSAMQSVPDLIGIDSPPLPVPTPLPEAVVYVAAAWPGSVDHTRTADIVGDALVASLPAVVGAAPGSTGGRRTLYAGDVATSLLAALTGSVAPYRVGALSGLLDVLALPVHDAPASVVSLAAGAGVGPEVSFPQALQLLGGPTQLGGLVRARRAGELAVSDIRITDPRVARLRAVYTALRSQTSKVIDLREPASADLAWHVAAIFDELDIPDGFETPVIACARVRSWADLHTEEAARHVAGMSTSDTAASLSGA